MFRVLGSRSREERGKAIALSADKSAPAAVAGLIGSMQKTGHFCATHGLERRQSPSSPSSARKQAYSRPTAHTFAQRDGSHCEWATAEARRQKANSSR
jgi:hypothetical protein